MFQSSVAIAKQAWVPMSYTSVYERKASHEDLSSQAESDGRRQSLNALLDLTCPGFEGNDWIFELDMETNWKPVQLRSSDHYNQQVAAPAKYSKGSSKTGLDRPCGTKLVWVGLRSMARSVICRNKRNC